ncbi:hypothetical protein NQ176_g723 [Zarea fungicola]|uniref:Uncharacterized protein n=1 Tax=Zarea fungicola TaxID=93591 RepID=A0ACC1NVP9_9HYPO|nr:hypothetical protein NQ176_g723 [Lecanicillium fungicola]
MTSKACALRYAELFQSPKSPPKLTTEPAPAVTEPAPIGAVVGESETLLAVVVHDLTDNTEIEQRTAVQELVSHVATDEISADEKVMDCIVAESQQANETLPAQAAAVERIATPELRYDDPRAIYHRYVQSREAWWDAQPRGSIKTNQQYRRAMNLPQRYNKADLAWCLDWKQMGKQCRTQKGFRDWTKEEMLAYLDWDKAEENRVEAMIGAEMKANSFSKRRGMDEIWKAAAADNAAQEALYLGK